MVELGVPEDSSITQSFRCVLSLGPIASLHEIEDTTKYVCIDSDGVEILPLGGKNGTYLLRLVSKLGMHIGLPKENADRDIEMDTLFHPL